MNAPEKEMAPRRAASRNIIPNSPRLTFPQSKPSLFGGVVGVSKLVGLPQQWHLTLKHLVPALSAKRRS
ncbi:MAG: hypothetical protein ACK5EA_17510, partial [Planctomycetaceae bacterium]